MSMLPSGDPRGGRISAHVGWSRVVRGRDEAGAAVGANRQAAVMSDGMSVCGQLHANLVDHAAALAPAVQFHRFEFAAVPDVPHPLDSGDWEDLVRRAHATDKEHEARVIIGRRHLVSPVLPGFGTSKSFVVSSDEPRRRRTRAASQPAASSRSPFPLLTQPQTSTGCCRLAASLRANPWSVGEWIVLHAISSLVHWCCICPGQGRAANPWWLRRPGSSDFQSTSRHSDCSNSRGPAPHLRYRSSTLSPPPVSVSNTFLGHRQPQDPLNWPACRHCLFPTPATPPVLSLHTLAALPSSRAFLANKYQSTRRYGSHRPRPSAVFRPLKAAPTSVPCLIHRSEHSRSQDDAIAALTSCDYLRRDSSLPTRTSFRRSFT